MTKMGPAEYVIHIFGGVRKAARASGRQPSSVCKWKKPRDSKYKGCNGDVPRGVHRTLLEAARERGLDLTAEDLLYGREVACAKTG